MDLVVGVPFTRCVLFEVLTKIVHVSVIHKIKKSNVHGAR